MHNFSRGNISASAVITAAALAFYLAIQWQLGFPGNIHQNLFSTSDSREYLEYSYWIGRTSGYCNPLRTFFYPFLVYLGRSIAGDTGLYVMQLLMWLAACNLVFLTTRRITANVAASFTAFVLAATNVSLINLTTFGLTEVTTFFLISLLLFLLSKAITQPGNPNPALWVLFVLGLLSVTKPLYVLLFYFSIVLFMFIYRKKFSRKIIILLVLCSAPVLVQKVISINATNTTRLTSVASLNLKQYLYPKVKYHVSQGTLRGYDERDTSEYRKDIGLASSLDKKDILIYLAEHPVSSTIVFMDDIRDNLDAPHPYIDSSRNHSLFKWAENINNKFFFVHILAFIAFLFFLVKRLRSADATDRYVLVSGTIVFYIFVTSGISYWAGDRLVAPAVAAWSSCYAVMFLGLLKKQSR